MNKKIFVLAFVSAAFLFGCSADYRLDRDFVDVKPPEWDGIPSTGGTPAGPPAIVPEPPVPIICALDGYGYCEEISDEYTEEDCEYYGGRIVSQCPDYSSIW